MKPHGALGVGGIPSRTSASLCTGLWAPSMASSTIRGEARLGPSNTR